ncbi:MAG: YdeI/OmpD-associated family protein [Acidobacteria bacterium]|nr:YdeI/OmpD-associated family protein [Acidobacteriota bacterium]
MKPIPGSPRDLPVLEFKQPSDWADWLEENHATSPGGWLRLAKKGSGIPSVSYDEALETALCFGWIDGQKKSHDEKTWLQKFTPRGPRSIWSKVNREKVAKLTASGRMRPAGLQAVERAKQGGQWDAAYDAQSRATVPPDLQAELDKNQDAKDFFATLNSQNRYAILFRIQTVKKAETRAKRIREFIAMLKRKEKLHP